MTDAATIGIAGVVGSLTPPYRIFKAVTPADGADLPDGVCFAISVLVAGAIKITDSSGNAVIVGAQVGLNYYCAKRIWATGTTATGIVACYN